MRIGMLTRERTMVARASRTGSRFGWLAVLAVLASALGGAYRPSASLERAAARITEDGMRAHVRFLAHDLLEGRGPSSRGDRVAALYVAAQFEALGLKPGVQERSYEQTFQTVGVTTAVPRTISFSSASSHLELNHWTEFQLASGVQRPSVEVADAELVFVGYGIQAPEHNWNDYKNADLRGKVLVYMNNDPASDPALFEGNRRLYYGRWDYKYEMAAKQGAAGAFIIHTTPSAGYPWQVVQASWSGELFELPSDSQPTMPFKGWLTEEASRRVFVLGGKDLDSLRAAAERRDFQPVPLGVKTTVKIEGNKIRKGQMANVVGLLPGSDPQMSKEAVLHMAHYDHLGIREAAKQGEDNICNGALDNASGVAGLLMLARAYTSLDPRQGPKRSVLFIATAGEESGLLGADYFAKQPTVQTTKIAAVLNMDGMGIWGRTRDVIFIGKGKTDLDDLVERVASLQRRVVMGDPFPDRGFFYRNDQFSLARVGVPGVYLGRGVEVIGKPEGWGRAQIENWEATTYHQPSDELKPDWVFNGMVEDVQLNFYVGFELARQKQMPRWKPGDEFEAARKQAASAP